MPQAGLGASQHTQRASQYAVLGDHLSGNINASEDVLNKLCEPVENEVSSSGDSAEVEEHLNTTWNSIISKAAETSFTDPGMSKLVNLITALQSRQYTQKDNKAFQIEDMTIWRDLPMFGRQMREAWNLAADERSDQQMKDQWININAFTAALVAAAHSKSNGKPDFSLYCIWTVRSGLEEDVEMVPEVSVAAASTWFVFAAPTIADLCRQGKSFEGKMARGGFSFQDQGWNGFSSDRWHAWEQRLKDVQSRVSEKSTKDLVQQAIEAISEVGQV